MVTQPAQGESGEGGQTSNAKEKTHLSFGETEAFPGEWKGVRRLGLGESLDNAGRPHDKDNAAVCPAEPVDR